MDVALAIGLKLLPLIWMVVGPVLTGLVKSAVSELGKKMDPKIAVVVSGVVSAAGAALIGDIDGVEFDPAQAVVEGAGAQALLEKVPASAKEKPNAGDDAHAANGGNAV